MTIFHILEKLNHLEEKIDGVDRWFTTSEACKYCNLSEKSLRRAVKKGTLKCSSGSGGAGKNLYLKSDIDKWLRTR